MSNRSAAISSCKCSRMLVVEHLNDQTEIMEDTYLTENLNRRSLCQLFWLVWGEGKINTWSELQYIIMLSFYQHNSVCWQHSMSRRGEKPNAAQNNSHAMEYFFHLCSAKRVNNSTVITIISSNHSFDEQPYLLWYNCGWGLILLLTCPGQTSFVRAAIIYNLIKLKLA